MEPKMKFKKGDKFWIKLMRKVAKQVYPDGSVKVLSDGRVMLVQGSSIRRRAGK